LNQHRKLRILCQGSLLDGWNFRIDNAGTRTCLHSDSGPLPRGYPWTDRTAKHYALAQAARAVRARYPNAEIEMVCAYTYDVAKRERVTKSTWEHLFRKAA